MGFSYSCTCHADAQQCGSTYRKSIIWQLRAQNSVGLLPPLALFAMFGQIRNLPGIASAQFCIALYVALFRTPVDSNLSGKHRKWRSLYITTLYCGRLYCGSYIELSLPMSLPSLNATQEAQILEALFRSTGSSVAPPLLLESFMMGKPRPDAKTQGVA